MNKLTPAILTLLVFLLAQGLGTALLFVIGMNATFLSLTLIAADILAVLCCYFLLHYIRFPATFDMRSVNWIPGSLAVAGGMLGAWSISVLTEDVELPDEMMQMWLQMSNSIAGFLAVVIVGPITEELLFREAIIGEMLRRGTNPWVAITISALAFSAMHLTLAQFLYALPLGILFGIIYYRTGNIVLTSLLHILNNGTIAAELYTNGEEAAKFSYVEWFGSATTTYTYAALSAALCIMLITVFWNQYNPRERLQE